MLGVLLAVIPGLSRAPPPVFCGGGRSPTFYKRALHGAQVCAGKAAAAEAASLAAQLGTAQGVAEAALAEVEALAHCRARTEGLETQLARARQEAASAAALATGLEGRLRRAEDEVEAAAGATLNPSDE